MTVRRLLVEMDSRELSEWMAFFQVEDAMREQETEGKSLKDKVRDMRRGRRR